MKITTLALAFLCCTGLSIASTDADEQDLFSRVRTESVFAPSTDATSRPAKRAETAIPELEVKVTSTGELARKLRLAGFKVDEDSENGLVSLEVARGSWTFPILVLLAEDHSRLTLAMLLSTAESEDAITKKQLLELLEANRKYAPVSFGYSLKRRRTELYHVLPNRLITGQQLRDEILRLADIAVETASIWNLKGSQTSAESSSKTDKPAGSVSLIGKWVATRSAQEAFAIEFQADGKFQLVYVKNTQQSRSNGTYSLDGPKLTLEGDDGLRLTGTLSNRSDQQFQMELGQRTPGTSPLTFKRAS